MGQVVNLMAHCGANYVDRNQLSSPVLPPSTRSYQPIGHDYFVDLVEDKLNDRGVRVVNSAFALGNDGANMFGVFECAGYADSDYATVVGMRNSHIQWFAAQLACGSGVFVCDNLAFSGDVTVGRKHTKNILHELPGIVEDAVGRVITLDKVQRNRYEAYKDYMLKTWEVEHLIIEMLRKKVINTTRVEKVVQQWDAPDHEEFIKTGDSAWRLFNAVTESLKGMNIHDMLPRTKGLHLMLDEVAEFSPEIAEAA